MMQKARLEKIRRMARGYLISIVFWCLLSLLTGWQYHVFDRELNVSSTIGQMLLLGQARGFAYALLTPLIFYVVRRYTTGLKQSFSYLWIYTLGVVPFMALFASIRWIILPPWDFKSQRFVARSALEPWQLIQGGFADQITMYIAIVLAAHAYNYFERVRRQERESYEYKQALAASELQSLKMQLHPHFLFNTLHGISTLIDRDQANAKAMVVKLSGLLRTALRYRGTDMISLREELAFVREYLELENMRLGSRLRVDWLIDPATDALLVPQMILQPLVENAIRHGIGGSRGKGWIEISANRASGSLELRIRNSVGPSPAGTGLGLRNTAARLRYLYSHDAVFSFDFQEGQIAVATLRLPVLGARRFLHEETELPASDMQPPGGSQSQATLTQDKGSDEVVNY